MVSDNEILEAYKTLAAFDGVFVEPASAASVAGLIKLNKSGYFKDKAPAKLVCILTGHGLKDPDRALKCVKEPKLIEPDIKAILQEIGY